MVTMNATVPAELSDIAPFPKRVDCPIVDFHVHSFDMPETEHLLRSMDLYGIERAVAVTVLGDLAALKERFAGRFLFCVPLDFSHSGGSRQFTEANLSLMSKSSEEGVIGIKLWFQPRAMAKHKLKISDRRLQALFDCMCDKKLIALVHIADPDLWYARYYSDRTMYGTKDEHYEQLEAFLGRNGKLTVVCAHLGGDPEHLDRVSRLLENYSNLHLDTSATKWVTRELSRKTEESRSFFIKHARRILFGTDNYVVPETDLRHYSLRYYVHRKFWETDAVFNSPILDPDAGGPVRLTGLNLPEDVLRQVYWENARRVLQAHGRG